MKTRDRHTLGGAPRLSAFDGYGHRCRRWPDKRRQRRERAALRRAYVRATREAHKRGLPLGGPGSVYCERQSITERQIFSWWFLRGNPEDRHVPERLLAADCVTLRDFGGRHEPKEDRGCVHCGGRGNCSECERGNFDLDEDLPW